MSQLEVAVGARVQTIRFNTPQSNNAFTAQTYVELVAALEAAEADPQVRVVLLTGGQECFTAGNDLASFERPECQVEAARFMRCVAGFSKVMIGAVNGLAIGIGATLLLHCDLVYVGRRARLKFPFVDLGLAPELAASVLLPAAVGVAQASRLLLLGEVVDGEEAARLGLVADVLDDDAVQRYAAAQAKHLARRPVAATRRTKALLRAAQQAQVDGALARELNALGYALRSPETGEALAAARDKRRADYERFE